MNFQTTNLILNSGSTKLKNSNQVFSAYDTMHHEFNFGQNSEILALDGCFGIFLYFDSHKKSVLSTPGPCIMQIHLVQNSTTQCKVRGVGYLRSPLSQFLKPQIPIFHSLVWGQQKVTQGSRDNRDVAMSKNQGGRGLGSYNVGAKNLGFNQQGQAKIWGEGQAYAPPRPPASPLPKCLDKKYICSM